jgi:hypothetical protein
MMSIQYYDYDGDIDFGIGAHRHDSERGHKSQDVWVGAERECSEMIFGERGLDIHIGINFI